MKDNTIPLELNTGEGANRFKYQTFKTRVERIKVDVVRRSRLIDDEPDEHGSFFYEALESWKDLNLTTHFKDFAREITPLVKSLPSIIYHKDTIVDILEKHIKVKESLALDGILDLVTKLAKDLEGEFYPYYARLMKCIIPLVYHRDIVLLESVFNCIAYLFKFLSRQILPNLDVTFHILENMLGEDNQTKPYVRHFTAEAFAFLMRKARGDDLKNIVKCIFDSLKANPSKEYEEGLAMLFFECIKQVDHQIHSRGEAIYKELLTQCFNEDISVEKLDESPVINLLTKTTLLILHHALRQHFTPIINILLKEMDAQINSVDEKLLAIQLTVLKMIVTVRKASRVQDFKPIATRLQDISKIVLTAPANTYSNYTYKELLRSIAGTLCNCSIESVVGTSRVILDLVIGFDDVDLIYGFFLSLAKLEWSSFTQICLPYILRYTSNNFERYPKETLLLLSKLIASDGLILSSGSLSSSFTADGLLRFPDSKNKNTLAQGILDILDSKYDWEKERDLLNNTDMNDENSQISSITVLGSALCVLPKIQVSVSSVSTILLSLFDSLLDFLKNQKQDNLVIDAPFVLAQKNFVLESLLGLVIESLAGIASHNTKVFDEMKKMHSKLMDDVLVSFSKNEVVLSGLFRYLDLLRSDIKNNDKFTLEVLQSLYPVIKGNLSSQKRNCRLNTLKIIVLFDQPLMKRDADHKIDEPCVIARLALDMEEIDPSFKEYREKVKIIQKLNIITSSKRTPDLYIDFVPLLCLGTLTVNLRPLWDDSKKCLITFSQINKDLYWKIIFGELNKYNDEKNLIWDGFSRSVMNKLTQPDEPETGNATKTGKISFECPTFSKFTYVEDKAWISMTEEKAQSLALMFVEMTKQEPGHMDYWNYYNILLQLLKENPSVTEPKTKDLVPLFLSFVENEFSSSPDDEDDDDDEEKEETSGIHLLQRSSKTVKNKMSNWLGVFSVFVNPKSAYKSQELFDIFMRLISMGDSKLQPAALECIFTWKDSNVKPYADNLRNLMDDVKFRDELSTFVQNEEQIMIDPAHRKGLMPLVMRILFGRIVQRSKSSNKSSKNSRRKVILSAVACCKVPEIRYFIDLALEPFAAIVALPGVETDKNGNVIKMEFNEDGRKLLELVPWRKQSGLLNLLEDMIKQMATHILPFLPDLLKVVLYIINFVHARNSDDMDIDQPEQSTQSNKSKEIKALALKRIVEMFRINGNFNFTPFVPSMFSSFISDRLETLPTESSQDLSTLTQLFLVWSKKETYAHYFADFDKRVLPQIIATLAVKKLNEQVLSALLEIIESLLDLCDSQMEVDGTESLKDKLIVPHVDLLLSDLKFRLTLSKDDVKFGTGRYSVREIAIAARIAEFTTNGEQAASIIDILLPSLKRPSKSIPEKSKQDIMVIWSKFIRIVPGFEANSALYHQYYIMACSLFATSYSRVTRTSLVEVFHAFAAVNPELSKVDELLTMLNSYSPKRIDEPDYDRMLDALSIIGEEYYNTFNIHQWLPILHQLVHCMRDTEEMAIRGTATHCMIQFLKATKEQPLEDVKHKMIGYINHVIYPAIKKGLRSRVELIRIEFVTVLNSCVKLFPELPLFDDLVPLLGEDEEANFFYNIYHMQIHRRSRALTRLAEYAPKGTLKAASINNIFIPIISAFFNESERTVDHNLLHQCTITLSSLASVLPWTPYYRLLQTYLDLVNKMEEKERLYVRVVIGLLDAFHFDLKDVSLSNETAKLIMGRQKVRINYLTNEEIKRKAAIDAGELKEEDDNETKEQDDEDAIPEEIDPEQKEKEKAEKIHEVLVTKIMPELNQFLNNNKSRKSVIVRVPLALGIAKLVRHLPEKSMRLNLPGLLTSVCHIIRSRAQDVRDITRETLIKINAFLGPSYFNFIVKELRGALKKGYELHVLGYTVNSLLLDMMPRLKVGDLDYCVKDLIELLVNDVFGATGQEKDADEMTGKTKEAKSRRSPQSFELLAKIVHFKNVGLMLAPLKEVMSQTESNRILRKVDDILRRISHGLVHNPEFESTELLDFSYGLISQNLEEFRVQEKKKVVKTQEEMNYEVQVKRPMVETIDYYRANAHRFVYFGLSLFSTGLKRTKYDLSDKSIDEKLSRLVSVIGNTLYTSQSANIVLAARIMCSLLLLPITGVQSAIDTSIKRVFQLLKSSGSSNNNTAQACLRLLTVCIRDNDKSKLSENQLTYLLDFIRPDMEELERHGTIFALLRAIISRKFMAPELYELMDTISSIFVTNQSKEIREQARSVYFTFLMDYPQGQGRLKKQMSFLTKNLEYVYETGRESVMELLHHVISKFGEDILTEFYDSIFFALVMRLVNDESAKCREMAAALIKSLLSRVPNKLPTIYRLLNNWLTQSSKPTLQRAACQVYGLAIDAFGTQVRPQIPELLKNLSEILQHSKSLAEELATETAENEEDEMEVEVQWEVAYYAINVFAKITKVFPKFVYDAETESVWRVMQYMLLYPHAWIRSSSTRLFGVYFSGIDAETRHVKESDVECEYLNKETLRTLATDFLEQLKSPHITQEQADQIVKNLFFIGKCFYFMSNEEDTHGTEEEIKIDDANDEVIEDEGNDKEAQNARAQIIKKAHKRSLNWLFRRASFDARGAAIRKTKNGILHRSSIYKWFAAMCSTIDTEELPPYLMPVVAPIYRTVNDEQNKAAGFDALQQLGNEVLNLLQAKAGPTIYFAVYQRVRQQVTKTREERKSKEAILAITNPTLAAKRKLDKNQRSKNAKKKRF